MSRRASFVLLLASLVALPLPAGADESMVASARLHVRAGPGLDQPIVGTLFAGERVLAGACRDDWCPITHVGPDGWVYAPYLVAAGFSRSWSAVSRDLPATLPAEDEGAFDPEIGIDVTVDSPCPSGKTTC